MKSEEFQIQLSLNIDSTGNLFWMKTTCHYPALLGGGILWIPQDIQKSTARMQATGKEKGGADEGSASRLLYGGRTIPTYLIDGIQIPLIVFRVGKKVSGTKSFGYFWGHISLNVVSLIC